MGTPTPVFLILVQQLFLRDCFSSRLLSFALKRWLSAYWGFEPHGWETVPIITAIKCPQLHYMGSISSQEPNPSQSLRDLTALDSTGTLLVGGGGLPT